MRRIKTVLLLFLTVITLFFVACAPEEGAVSESVAEDTPTTVAGEDALADEFKQLNEKAKAYIVQEYGVSALKLVSFKSAEVIDNPRNKNNGSPELVYLIDVYGYGWGRLEFTFDAEGEILRHSEMNEEPLFYSHLLTEEMLDEAAAKISEEAGESLEKKEYYFRIDDGKYLCLSAEIIVEFDRVEEDGSVTHDHKHVFYNERLTILTEDLFGVFD